MSLILLLPPSGITLAQLSIHRAGPDGGWVLGEASRGWQRSRGSGTANASLTGPAHTELSSGAVVESNALAPHWGWRMITSHCRSPAARCGALLRGPAGPGKTRRPTKFPACLHRDGVPWPTRRAAHCL